MDITVSPNGNIRSRLTDPADDQKRYNEIFVKGGEWYRWNAIYKTYNGLNTNNLLAFKQYTQIDWEITTAGLEKFYGKS